MSSINFETISSKESVLKNLEFILCEENETNRLLHKKIKSFLFSLPNDILIPNIVLNSDMSVDLEWSIKKDKFLSINLTHSDNKIYYISFADTNVTYSGFELYIMGAKVPEVLVNIIRYWSDKMKDSVIKYKTIITNSPDGKIVKLDSLLERIESLRKNEFKILLVNGTYDILHYGHVKSLYETKNYRYESNNYTNVEDYYKEDNSGFCYDNNILIVLINSDNSIKKLKGESKPIINEYHRAYMLACLEFVNYVCIFDTIRITKHLELIHPDRWIKSGDYSWDNIDASEREMCIQKNIKTHFLPKYENDLSTSSIIKKIKELE